MYEVRWDASCDEGDTEWLNYEEMFLADPQSTMTIEKLSALYPHLVVKVAHAQKVKAAEDVTDKGFLEKWIKTASVPSDVKAAIQKRLKSGVMTGIVEEVVWWRKVEGAAGDDVNASREFKVKWAGLCYRRCQWLPRKVAVHLADRKVFGFERRYGLSKNKDGAGEEEAEEEVEDSDEEDADFFEGVRADWLIVERIVYEEKPTKKFLVKWKGLGYEHVTWEKASDLRQTSDVALIDRHRAYMERYLTKDKAGKRATKGQDASTKAITTECTLLTKQPAYLRGGTLFEYQMEGLNWMRRKRGLR